MEDSSKPATNTTSAATQNNEFIGYVHKVSPVCKEKFLECQLQGKDQTITIAVCFSPRKHKIFEDYSEKKSPIKVKKFNVDTSSNTNDILMGDSVILEHYPQLDFSRSEMKSSTMLSSVKSVRIGQHVSVKAKVTNMSKEEKAGDLTLVNCTLLDPSASIEMVLWENFINQVENNRTYIFHNVTV